MELEPLLSQFGYLAIFLGTVVEGESVLLLGGFFAEQGFMSLPVVVLFGTIGTFCSEAALYHLGLSKGPALMRRSPERLARYERFVLRLHRHRYLLILGYRFFYGMRTVAPLAIGASGIRPGLFHSLNLIGTLIWTLALTSLGFFFGRAIGQFLEQFNGYGIGIIAVLLVAAVMIRVIFRARNSAGQTADCAIATVTDGTRANTSGCARDSAIGRAVDSAVNGIDNNKVASTGGIHE